VEWSRSSYSGANGNCVEVAVPDAEAVLVRDSKNPEGGYLTVDRASFRAFIEAARSGKLEN
jgi:hypothetical protein